MRLYSENDYYKLYEGNMLDMLEVIESNSIDSIITDPPYGLTSITKRFGKENSAECQYGKDGSFARLSRGFMGKEWDGSGIEYNIEAWKKCYEVLKPGGYLLAFGGSRTFHRIACAIEDAGFEIRDTIMWLYGSGFPKSMDISKQIDKKGGNDYSKQFAIDLKQARESRNLTMKYCDDKYCNGSTNWSWYEGRKDGCRVPDYNTYLEIVKDFPELEKYRELIKEAEREIIGKKESGCFNNQEKDRYTIGSGKTLEVDITIPSTDLAKKWQGWGTALKPSFEPIIVARKPLDGTVAKNCLKWGVGGINIDECRVGTEKVGGGTMPDLSYVGQEQKKNGNGHIMSFGQVSNAPRIECEEHIGRFPANTILTYDETDFDEVCGGFPNTSGKGGNKIKSTDFRNYGESFGIDKEYHHFNDSGSASRYFYCAKASKKDRDEGLDEFVATTDKAKGNGLDRVCEFCGVSQLTPELCKCEIKSWITKPKKNIHPTVKPTELMQYLVRLVTPKGGIVLDCFNGSGSTGKAVMYENKERNANYKYIGIELTEEYLPIAKARIEYAYNLKEENPQLSLF